MSLDLYADETADKLSSLPPVQNPDASFLQNLIPGAAKTAMRGLAATGRAVDLLGSVGPILQDKFDRTGTEAQDKYFQEHDDVFNRAVDYWTPKANEVGTAGQVVGGLVGALPVLIASPELAVASAQLDTGEDLAKAGVSTGKAQIAGALSGASMGLGLKLPFLGNTLWSRVGTGAAGNVALGLATRGIQGEVLDGTPAEGQFKAVDGGQVGLDLLMGLAFGGLAHYHEMTAGKPQTEDTGFWQNVADWAQNLKPSDKDAISTLRQAQHMDVDSMPGAPVDTTDINAHVDRLRAAIEQTATDNSVNVEDMPAANTDPIPGRKEADDARFDELQDTIKRQQISEETQQPVTQNVPTGPHSTTVSIGPGASQTISATVSGGRVYRDTAYNQEGEQTRKTSTILNSDGEFISAKDINFTSADSAETPFQGSEYEANEIAHLTVEMEKDGADRFRMQKRIDEIVDTVNRRNAGLPPKDIVTGIPHAEEPTVGVSSPQIYQNTRDQLLATGRVTREQAHNDAMIADAFYGATAKRLGMTPEALHELHPLNITSDATTAESALGQAARTTETPEFKNWFGDSKVADASGKPIVVYHGTHGDFSTFDGSKQSYFTADRNYAERYARGEGGNLIPTYLSIKNPLDLYSLGTEPLSLAEFTAKLKSAGVDTTGIRFDWKPKAPVWAFMQDDIVRKQIQAAGYDGVIQNESPIGEEDANTKAYVTFKPEQIKSAIGNRGTFDPKNPNMLYQDKTSWYYSELGRQIDNAKINAAPADQWKNYVKGLANKGVKADEVKWSGLEDWLDLQKGKVTKQQIADFMSGNGVKVSEVQLGGEQKRGLEGADAARFDDLIGRPELTTQEETELDRLTALSEANLSARPPQTEPQTKFAGYQLPGGKNYRELLLTLPSDVAEADRGTAYARDHTNDFQSTHFAEPNILAHVRFNDRTDADGKHVLFLEEIQSDWGQKGKKSGFRVTPEREAELIAKINEIENIGKAATPAQKQEWADAMTELQPNTNNLKPPAGPFVGKTEAWVALALKRMIRYAAEHGYDRIAWTNGEQQAERYDLSKHIMNIAYSGSNFKAFDHAGKEVITRTGVRPEDLPDLIGKDAAEKLMAQKPNGTLRVLEGADLKIGGEGMKAFYDKIVPQVAKDVLKKLGGGEVHEIPMVETDGKNPQREIDNQPGFDITPEMRNKAMGGLPLFQNTEGERRGYLSIGDGQRVMGLMEHADASTFIHESGHFFLDVTNEVAKEANAPAEIKADLQKLYDWFGVKDADTWNKMTLDQQRPYHEKFARGFEQYLAEGKAPNANLQGVFDRFKDWLLEIYKSLTKMNVGISDDVRGVMDRMLAGEPVDLSQMREERAGQPAEKPLTPEQQAKSARVKTDLERSTELSKQGDRAGAAAWRFAAENEGMLVDGVPIRDFLTQATQESEQAIKDSDLFGVAAECMLSEY